MRRLWGPVALVVASLALAGSAAADVAPLPRPDPTPTPTPPPTPDATCLESEVRHEGEECSRCQNADPACAPRLEQAGFERRCSSAAYTVLCAPRDRDPAPVPEVAKPEPAQRQVPPPDRPVQPTSRPPETDAGGCTCDTSSPGSGATALAVALVALLAAARRR